MSRYFIHETNVNLGNAMTAGFKAREDAEAIVRSIGFKELQVTQSTNFDAKPNTLQKIRQRLASKGDWQRALETIQSDDVVFFQLPIKNHSIQVAQYLSELVSIKHIKLIALIHDLEIFRIANMDKTNVLKREEILNEEQTLLESCSNLILHNEYMRSAVRDQLGVEAYKKSVSLELFDYLTGITPIRPLLSKNEGVIIAGNLNETKAGYAYHLPENTQFNLYGIDYTGTNKQNISYYGVFAPEDLPAEMVGSFGLIWDGPSPITCNDVYGEYLRINNPHKASLYLTCGIPIIIWNQAALASFVIEHGVGITIADLHDINGAINAITDSEYECMQQNAQALSIKLRQGYFLRTALAQIGIKSEKE